MKNLSETKKIEVILQHEFHFPIWIFHINGKLFVLTFILSVCHIVADNRLYKVVDGVGFIAYNSAQKNACSCIPDDQTASTQLVQPKTTAIDIEQSKSIFQNIKDDLYAVFSRFFVESLLISSPIFKSPRFIVNPVINFFYGICENFGCTPLNSEAGFMDTLSYLTKCITNVLVAALNVIVSQTTRLIGG